MEDDLAWNLGNVDAHIHCCGLGSDHHLRKEHPSSGMLTTVSAMKFPEMWALTVGVFNAASACGSMRADDHPRPTVVASDGARLLHRILPVLTLGGRIKVDTRHGRGTPKLSRALKHLHTQRNHGSAELNRNQLQDHPKWEI